MQIQITEVVILFHLFFQNTLISLFFEIVLCICSQVYHLVRVSLQVEQLFRNDTIHVINDIFPAILHQSSLETIIGKEQLISMLGCSMQNRKQRFSCNRWCWLNMQQIAKRRINIIQITIDVLTRSFLHTRDNHCHGDTDTMFI